MQSVLFAVQAVIFYWQGRILRHHGAVMGKQAEISAMQTEIAAKQAKIAADQLEFEKSLHASAEYKAMFELGVAVVISVRKLLTSLQDRTHSNEVLSQTKQAWADMQAKADCLGQALLSTQYLSPELLRRFKDYFYDVSELAESDNRRMDAECVQAFETKHKDFLRLTKPSSSGTQHGQ